MHYIVEPSKPDRASAHPVSRRGLLKGSTRASLAAAADVRGYIEEGTTTTPFDMVVLNKLDRFHLAMDVIEWVPGLGSKAAHLKQHFRDKLIEHRDYVGRYGKDMPEIQNWSWPYNTAGRAGD